MDRGGEGNPFRRPESREGFGCGPLRNQIADLYSSFYFPQIAAGGLIRPAGSINLQLPPAIFQVLLKVFNKVGVTVCEFVFPVQGCLDQG